MKDFLNPTIKGYAGIIRWMKPLGRKFALAGLSLFFLLSSCEKSVAPPLTPTSAPQPAPSATATSEPMAVLVNGEGISLAEFHDELARFQSAQAALGRSVPAEEAGRIVLDDLVNRLLLAQGAAESGFSVDDATLQARLDSLAESLGGQDSLAAWEAAHGYTAESFSRALRREISAAWMRDEILQSLPDAVEQVHARQILLYNEDAARAVLARLDSGDSFEEIAEEYDAVTRGDLGWFPRGYLLEPAIEDAAFSMQVGEVSDIIQTGAGYHILKVEEREAERPLSPDARLTLQENALSAWLETRRAQSTIEFLLSP